MKKFWLALLALLLFAVPAFAEGTNDPVALKSDEGVFLSWPMEAEDAEYTIYRNGEEIAKTKITNYTDLGADGSAVYRINDKEVSVWENRYLEIPIKAPTPPNIDFNAVRDLSFSPNMAIGSQWTLYTLEDGASVFVNAAGKVVDVNAQATTPGGKVGTYDYNNGDNQKFFLEETTGGYLIRGKQSNLYLNVDNDGNVTIEEQASATVFKAEDIASALTPEATQTLEAIAGKVTYSANDASVGDLDGDGEWEVVLKWDPSDSKDASQQGKTGRVFIDAYKLDGTMLWRIDMGPNIRAGAHDTQMVVYDLDGDGKAEIALRTADGTVDGEGRVIGDKAAVWTNNWAGKNLEGPLWLTVFDGKSGAVLDSIPFDPQNNEPDTLVFGDDFGNRSERYNACVAYLDGVNPFVVFQRGYYHGRPNIGPGRTVIAAYSWNGEKIEKYWRFDTMDEGKDIYIGQGNHNISVGDVDNDGKDEILTGALVLDDDGSVLWCSFMGHGDAMHLSDFDPDREGLELFAVHEDVTEVQNYGFTIFDAKTGEIIWTKEAGKDTGRGVMANIGPFGGNYVAWAGSGAGKINSWGETLDFPFNSMNFRIYWDGDLYDELLDGTAIFKINDEGGQDIIFDAGVDGCVSNNGSKSTPCLQADIMGDWREEVIWRSADNTCLRIYTTTTPSEFALPPLMTDHVYRMGVVWQNSSYNQPPHLGYFPAGLAELTIDHSAAKVNGRVVELDAAPYIADGRTLVPLRFIAEALGAKVSYDNGTVTVLLGDRKVVMTIGSLNYTVNGENRTMDTEPVIVNSRTMIPVRAVSEALGMIVSWNNETKSVVVKREDSKMSYESAGPATTAQAGKVELAPVKVFIASDSTAQSYRESAAPQAGWGQMLSMFFDDSVTVENRAMAGRSLKSFFNEGRWQSILNDAAAGDYVVIQFGHNDGAWQKPERYLSHEDFAVMLEEEYILPALAKGLKPIIATQTQSRWFDAETGKIYPPGNGVSYATLLMDAAEKYSLPLLDINALSRDLQNELGPEESKKIHLYSAPGEYPAFPDGAADDTHFSFYGAFEIARLAAEAMGEEVPDLAARRKDGYVKIVDVEGDAAIDVRCYGFADEFSVAIASEGGTVTVNGMTVIAPGSADTCVTRVSAENGFINIAAQKAVVEVSPIWRLAPEGGIETSGGEVLWNIPDGTYDFTFVKSDKERGDVHLNGVIVGANVDMYGTVGVPEGTRYTYPEFEIKGGARISVTERTSRLRAVEAVKTPSILKRKTKVFVAGDSTLCNYYPILPAKAESEITPGTVRTGWGQVLDRFLPEEYEVINLAASGDWARDWKDKYFPTVLANGKRGDYIIIQFGINDRNRDDKQQSTMKDALEYMVNEANAKGMIPVLVKPQPSVGYTWGNAGEFEKPNGNNGGFFNAVEETANEIGCLFVNLYDLSGEHFAEVGRDFVVRNYQLWNHNSDEAEDKLHISFAGAKTVASYFMQGADEQGILPMDGYMELKKIENEVYVLSNGQRTKLINNSGAYKKITAGAAELTLAPYSELVLEGAPEIKAKDI